MSEQKTIIIGGNLSLLPDPESEEALKLEARLVSVADGIKRGKTRVIHFGRKKVAITPTDDTIEVELGGQGSKVKPQS